LGKFLPTLILWMYETICVFLNSCLRRRITCDVDHRHTQRSRQLFACAW
jgi:hypothetical protein